MPYQESDYAKLANGILNTPRSPSFQVPPKTEITIEDVTIGIWEFEETFAYCEKKSSGYPQYEIVQIDKRIINAMKGD